MKSTVVSVMIAVLSGTSAVACVGEGASAPLGDETTDEVASALPANWGLYPYPVKMTTGGGEIDTTAAGPTITWKGSLTDLMAADAYADCVASDWLPWWDGYPLTDGYLSYLGTKMNESIVAGVACSGVAPASGGLKAWSEWRHTAACNIDGGAQKAIRSYPRNAEAYQALFNSSSPGTPAFAAVHELGVAEINLCMAQRLRETMSTAPGLLMEEQDMREALAVLRERSQVAMLQYSALAVALTHGAPSADETTRFNANSALYGSAQPVYPLEDFGVRLGVDDKMKQLGSDFAAAIDLHSRATLELGQYLARSASARSPWSASTMTPVKNAWAKGSWRERMLRLFYGGDPLGPTFGEAGSSAPAETSSLWRVYPAEILPQALTRYVENDNRSPQVDELLHYAKRADAVNVDYATAEYPMDSAISMYRAVEASFRHPECTAQQPAISCVELAWEADIPDPITEGDQCEVYQKRRLTIDHAQSLLRRLAQAMPAPWLGSSKGVLNFSGSHSLRTSPSGTDWYHFAPTFKVIQQTPLERAAPYLRGHHLPTRSDGAVLGSYQGFVTAPIDGDLGQPVTPNDAVFSSTAMRTLGAVSAQAVARDALFTALRQASENPASSSIAAFTTAANAASGVSRAAIGDISVSVRPVYQLYNEVAQEHAALNGSMQWNVRVQVPTGTPAPTILIAPDASSEAYMAMQDASFVAFDGTSRSSILASGSTQTLSPSDVEYAASGARYRFQVDTPGAWVFLVQAGEEPGAERYIPLLEIRADGSNGLPLWTTPHPLFGFPYSTEGRWFASGGAMNELVDQTWRVQIEDWSKPAYDAFGIRTNWFPPTSAELFGGAPGQSAQSFYSQQSQSAAAFAQARLQTAVSQLIQEQADEEMLDASRQRAELVAGNEVLALCGPMPRSQCEAGLRAQPLLLKSLVGHFDCPFTPCAANAVKFVDVYNGYLNSVVAYDGGRSKQISIPQAVAEALAYLPSYSEYAGGVLQTDFITLWRTIDGLRRASADATAAIEAKLAQGLVAQAELDAAGGAVELHCNTYARERAVSASISYNVELDLRDELVDPYGDYVGTATINFGPIYAQREACEQAALAVGPAVARSASLANELWLTMSQQVSSIRAQVAEIAIAAAAVSRHATETRLRIAESNLDANLAQAGMKTRIGTYRRFYSADLREAVKAIESARLSAVLARRATESRLVVDLSTMLAPELGGIAPASWSDTIYRSDLAPLPEMGMTVVGSQVGAAVGVSPVFSTSIVADYVAKLERFSSTYFGFGRNASVEPSQTNVINLPAPNAKRWDDVVGGYVLDPESFGWEFQCAGSDPWFVNPAIGEPELIEPYTLSSACGGAPPVRARRRFSLDGWGRLNSDEASVSVEDPFTSNFNVRWNHLAVNVGGPVKDCTGLPRSKCDPGAMFVPYDLRVTGGSWVTDFDGRWHTLATPVGKIESGQAAATYSYWTTPLSGQTASEVATFSKPEFVLRPVSGIYELELKGGPGIDFAQIEWLQLFVDYTYWVRQE